MLIINTLLIWDFRGVSGLVRLAGGSNREYTYFAFSGSPDLAIRVTPQDQDSTICGPLIAAARGKPTNSVDSHHVPESS